MLDIKALRQDPESIAQLLARKGFSFDVSTFQSLEAQRKSLQVESEQHQADKNKLSKKIGELIGQGMAVADARAQVDKDSASINERMDELSQQLKAVQEQLDSLLLGVPNIPHESVPEGADEDANVEVLRW